MTTPIPCYHCALPVPPGSRFTAVILGESRELCCPGCQAVAEAIVAGGLESYYQHRSEASANPEALPVQLGTSWRCMTVPMCKSPSCATTATCRKPRC